MDNTLKRNNKMNENGFNNTRATIKDVAVKANVSLSTVSRALREPDKTPAETVSKVRAAAEALNYVYNATAGSLSKRRSDTIGILLPSPTYAAFGVNLMAIQKTCSERNYSCKVALSQFSPEEERLAMRRFHEQRIGGLILVGLDMSNVEYMKTLEAAGIPIREEYIQICENLTELKAEQLAKHLFYQNPRVTAVVAFNDSAAMAIYKAAKDCGLSIPAQLSVIGFDDTTVAAYMSPPLTSVWQPSYDKGEKAMRLLIDCLEKGVMPKKREELNCIIMYRESCAAAPQE